MQEDYFGITNQLNQEIDENDNEFHEKLVKKGILERFISYKVQDDNIIWNEYFGYSTSLKKTFFEFILETYFYIIDSKIRELVYPFESKIYGLTKNEERPIALNKFNKIFEEEVSILLSKSEKSESGIIHRKTKGKLLPIKYALDSLASYLSEDEELVNHFLAGNRDIFNVSLVADNKTLEKVIDRYSKIQFLIQLNDTYKFEPDWYFSADAKIKKAYEIHREIIPNKNVFIHVYKKIQDFKEDEKSKVNALYVSLRKCKLIGSENHKMFINFTNQEFKIRPSKLSNPDGKFNSSQTARIEKYSKELKEIAVLK